MNLLSSVTGEMSDSKVAAVFDDESEARAIARQVQHMLHMQPAQVQVVTPHHADLRALGIAHALEQANGHTARRPV